MGRRLCPTVDAGPSLYPLGATYDGAVYHHEKGRSADGGRFAWFIATADRRGLCLA